MRTETISPVSERKSQLLLTHTPEGEERERTSAHLPLFLATDHAQIADLLVCALGNDYQLLCSQHRASDFQWQEHLLTCLPRPAVVILEVACFSSRELLTFLVQVNARFQQRSLHLPVLVVSDYHLADGPLWCTTIRKPFSIVHLRTTVAHLLLHEYGSTRVSASCMEVPDGAIQRRLS